MLRLSVVFFIFLSNVFSQTVVVAKESIRFGEELESEKLVQKDVNSIKKSCVPLLMDEINNNKYVTTHFINKNSIICQKDIKKGGEETVIFNFGGLQIEKKGTVIYENDEFIRIKNQDGTIEKIYKDGKLR